jgi:protocatechuate 4,5-dioxygenase beta chain
VRAWLQEVSPDVAVVLYNDHGRTSALDLVREAGAQGGEFVMWLAMRGARGTRVRKLHANYHIPISNTAVGMLLLESAA